MKRTVRLATLASAIAAALLVTGCAQGPEKVLETLGRNYAHCERTVTYTASVGPLNPTSGAIVTGTVSCQPQAAPTIAPGQLMEAGLPLVP